MHEALCFQLKQFPRRLTAESCLLGAPHPHSWGPMVFVAEGGCRWCIAGFTKPGCPFARTPHTVSLKVKESHKPRAHLQGVDRNLCASELVHRQTLTIAVRERRVEKEMYALPLHPSPLHCSDTGGWHRGPSPQAPQGKRWLSSCVSDRPAFIPPPVLLLLSNFNRTNQLVLL